MTRWSLLFSIFLFNFGGLGVCGDRSQLPLQAHSHNDYEQRRPLLDAVHQGFCSVEVDLFLVEGDLLVGHDRSDLRPGRTLQSLYLDPLRELVRTNNGSVQAAGGEFFLLIDIKSDAEPAYDALKKVLNNYSEMLTKFTVHGIQTNSVTVIISGNRPLKAMGAERERLAGIDGRLSDLSALPPISLVPWISDKWGTRFQWNGTGEMPASESALLKQTVSEVHRKGRKVRFWAAPDNARSWKEQQEAGVDFINTDKLEELARALGARPQTSSSK